MLKKDGIRIIDLAIIIGKTLIICDTHIGYEEALNKQGFLIPRFQFKEIIERLEKIIKKSGIKKFERIIINGDIKHEFGRISEQEWRHTLRLLDFLKKHCKKVILIKGNHDTILGPIANKRNLKVLEYFIFKKVLIVHGNKLPDKYDKLKKNIKKIIIGHEHPAVGIRENARTEIFKCYLFGKFRGKQLIVQPSFNFVSDGTDVLKEQVLSPFLKGDLGNFKCMVVSDKLYNFGKLANLIKNKKKKTLNSWSVVGSPAWP